MIFVACQVVVLALQDVFGPRFLAPCIFTPSYDYKQHVDPLHVGECVICMSPIIETNIENKVL
jgi:hypothetical protein